MKSVQEIIQSWEIFQSVSSVLRNHFWVWEKVLPGEIQVLLAELWRLLNIFNGEPYSKTICITAYAVGIRSPRPGTTTAGPTINHQVPPTDLPPLSLSEPALVLWQLSQGRPPVKIPNISWTGQAKINLAVVTSHSLKPQSGIWTQKPGQQSVNWNPWGTRIWRWTQGIKEKMYLQFSGLPMYCPFFIFIPSHLTTFDKICIFMTKISFAYCCGVSQHDQILL